MNSPYSEVVSSVPKVAPFHQVKKRRKKVFIGSPNEFGREARSCHHRRVKSRLRGRLHVWLARLSWPRDAAARYGRWSIDVVFHPRRVVLGAAMALLDRGAAHCRDLRAGRA